MQKSRELGSYFGSQGVTPTQLGYAPYGHRGCSTYHVPDDVFLFDHLSRMNTPTAWYPRVDYVGEEYISSSELPRPWYNNVYHRKIQGINLPFATWHSGPSSAFCTSPPYSYGMTRNVAYRLPSFEVSAEDDVWLRSVHFKGLDLLPNLQRNAWHAMQPRFESRISMLNALFELKDFKDALRTLAKLRPWRIARLLRKGVPKPGTYDPSKPLAGLWLTNALMIQPLLRDIETVVAQIHDLVLIKQYEFELQGEETQKSHWTAELDRSYAETYSWNNWEHGRSYGKLDTTIFTATLEYQYRYKTRKLLDAFKSYWGLGLTYEAMWNAVPFTFLLDYFAGIGTSIHNMRHDPNVDLRYTQYCESLKVTRATGYYLVTSPTATMYDTPSYAALDGSPVIELGAEVRPETLAAGTRASIYKRIVTRPNKGAALPILKLPTSNQWTTMAALLRTFL